MGEPSMSARIKFVMAGHLGWKTYRERIEMAASADSTAKVDIQHFSLPKLLSHIGRRPNYEDRLPFALPFCSEHQKYFYYGSVNPIDLNGFNAAVGVESHVAAALLSSAKNKIPTIQVLDATLRNFRNDFKISGISDQDIKIENQLFLMHSHTICLSNWAANSLIKDYGLSEDRVTVIPPPSFSSTFQLKRKKPNNSDRLRVAFIAGDFIRKGGLDVIRWQKTSWHQFVDLSIITQDKYVDCTIPNTTWHTNVGPSYIASEIFPNVDVQVLPTTRECSSFVSVEAACFGVPTIATKIGGIGDLIVDGKSGRLLNPERREEINEILMMLQNDRNYLAMLSAGSLNKFLDYFALENVYSQIMKTVQHEILRWGTHKAVINKIR
jgi:Glycosyl transferases group 1